MSSGRCGEPGRVPAGISLDNWLSPPHSHWSFQHIEDFMPTAVIPRGRAGRGVARGECFDCRHPADQH
ncbi:putative 6-aminohexanoate-dimer hydrolase domain protein [Mycobacterium kansasii]|uniref:Putative 6-aminohexanoate-dimer hydrolase domain protein n=1 Tax=Mycobacterium kansasii TaxID=1768 RepID=A0A1V3X482_MYCKA|nr:putative 6-aminohexanoate-dimer hydrolase domain protein [Mycobacterium kansasii]